MTDAIERLKDQINLLNRKSAAEHRALELYIQNITDESVMMEVAYLYPEWEGLIGKTIKTGFIFQYGENGFGEPQLYQSIGPEHVGAEYNPPSTLSLYKTIGFKDEYPIWTQPLSTLDAYDNGDIVWYNDELWVSVHDGKNTWTPGVYGWERYK